MRASLQAAGACLALVLGACTTLQGYEGERRPTDEVARVTGDFRINAGAPVSVILLQVDGQTLGTGTNSVELLPGEHTFLVNCRIAETNALSRHSIVAEVVAGRHYRFEAETGPGLRECMDVRLVSGY
jgi:hypothetical protein